MKIIDLSGEKFDFLTVVELSCRDKLKGKTYWRCICDCGEERVVDSSVLKSKTVIARCSFCKIKADKELRWKGYGEISGDFYSSIIRGAKSRKIDFNVSIEELWDLFLRQDRRCALTGQEIVLSAGKKLGKSTASLDRIDSKIGYNTDNVQWIHKDINIIKGDFSQEYFIKLCHLITNRLCE